jgi:ubiquinone/menaquinone biosynthesis C-methylase UbiE
MESPEETLRLDLKTDPEAVRKQALWAGVRPGMRIADLGCGSGKTSSILFDLVQPGGTVVGVDFAEERWRHAAHHYSRPGLEFQCLDIRAPLEELETFDLIWVRFVLEYYLADSPQLLANVARNLNPGGTLCLIDLDHNCLSHYGMNERLNQTLFEMMEILQQRANFDPYAGRKLYSYLYDLGLEDITMEVGAHHLIFGELKEVDDFNWLKKIEVAPQKIGYLFPAYQGSYEAFLADYTAFFHDPRRFTYTPVISCRGRKPLV